MNAARNRIQRLIVEYLMKEGSVELMLPKGMMLEVSITQENKFGNQEITQDYCSIMAHQSDRSVRIDNYNLGLSYAGDKQMVCEDTLLDENGKNIKLFDVL